MQTGFAGGRMDIRRSLARFARPPYVNVLTVAIPSLFLLLGLVRARPFADDVRVPGAGDDWEGYKRFALSILHDGLAIPALDQVYTVPAGFLYNYFVAAVFFLLGVNSSYVYVVQSAMLGASVSLMYLTFRDRLSPATGLAYLLLLTLFMLTDVFVYYSFRLLSENLLLFLLPGVFWLLFRSHETGSALRAAGAGMALGLAVLTRPNMLSVAAALTLVAVAWRWRSRGSWVGPVVFLAAWAVTASTVMVRNYVVVGQLSSLDTYAPFLEPGIRWAAPESAQAWLVFYAKRILYVLGFLPVLVGKFPVLPHWILMWLAFGLSTIVLARRGRPLEFWETVVYLYIFLYLIPVVAAGQIASYGIRMLVPVVPAVLLIAVKLLEDRVDEGDSGAPRPEDQEQPEDEQDRHHRDQPPQPPLPQEGQQLDGDAELEENRPSAGHP